ncbi:MAG: phosphoadenosine phosphosulfate reductase family protein [Candidatus Paceibacterota bacterium]
MSDYDGAMVSFGGGINSTALVIYLAEQGWRGDVVFADTGCEHPETYCYMQYFEAEYLTPRGLTLTRLRGLPYQRGRATLPLVDYCEQHGMVPLAAARWCTKDWKGKPIERWCAANGDPLQLLGIAAEEAHRAPEKARPLVDAGIDRRECVAIIQRAGLDVPQKSGCTICPFQRDSQWHGLWRLHPELFERAARLEEGASARTGRFITLDPAGKITLRQRQARYEAQMPLIDDATMDGLRAFQPCVCGL